MTATTSGIIPCQPPEYPVTHQAGELLEMFQKTSGAVFPQAEVGRKQIMTTDPSLYFTDEHVYGFMVMPWLFTLPRATPISGEDSLKSLHLLSQ